MFLCREKSRTMSVGITVDETRDGVPDQSNNTLSGIRLQLLLLGVFRFSEAVAWASIFPYVYFMIEGFPEIAEVDIAFYSGMMIAVFTFCEFLSAMIWAKISDRIGRKWTLLFGLVGGVVCAVTLGFSKSITVALASRAIGGLMNPNVGVVQTCVGELAKDKGQQARAFPVVSFLRGTGSLIGPVLGGLLADPAKHYPSVFQHGSMWEYYPYLLPNLVVGLLLVVSMLLGFLFLKETHSRLAQKPDMGLKLGKSVKLVLTEVVRRRFFGYSRVQEDPNIDAFRWSGSEIESNSVTVLELQPSTLDCSLDALAGGKHLQTPPKKAFTLQVVLQISSVSLLAFHKVSSDIIIPTFLAFPPASLQDFNPRLPRSVLRFSGGFGLSMQKIGLILLTQACIAIIAQGTLIPFVVGRYGALKIYRSVLCIFPIMYLFTPFIVRLAPPFSTIALLLDLWVKVLLSSMGYVCSAILITNTAPSRDLLARINGAAASFGCFARSIGPLLSGKLFGWGVQVGFIGISFWTLSAVALIGASLSWFLKDHP